MRSRHALSLLPRDARGATMVEFALLAPVLLTLLLGIFDLGFNVYTTTQLEGAIQKAARDSSIEGAGTLEAAIDAKVRAAVHDVVPNAKVTFARRSYATFGDVSRPEDFTDVNKDGLCNDGEPFEDANGNGSWDEDRGRAGFGGARDAVLYTVDVSYPRVFPVAKLIGLPPVQTTQAVTVLRNQPYGQQASDSIVKNCE